MTFHLPLFRDETMLPTGKNHISFSEVSTILECGWRHKLKYVNKLEDPGSEHTVYGSCIHDSAEEWLLNKDSAWFDLEESIERCTTKVKEEFSRIKFDADGNAKKLEKEWIAPIRGILTKIPSWMEETFPGYSVIAAELELFESFEGQHNKWYKGFVDCIIKTPKKARRGAKNAARGSTYWILDWKTTSWGWDKKKQTDPVKKMQLALYKHFVSKKLDIPFEDIKCGFVLLKRTAKGEEYCDLLEVPVSDQTRLATLKIVSNAINVVKRRMWTKERGDSCRYCEFFVTEHCNWDRKQDK